MFGINPHLFPGQQEDEEIKLVIREHWFRLLVKVLFWFVFVVVLFLMDKYLPVYAPVLYDPTGPYLVYISLFKNIYTMFLILGIFMTWTLYYLNIQIITNHRIVDVDQQSLFNHTVSELSIAKIEDVTGQTKGLFGTIFSYGNVYVQTAGSVDRFTFENVPHPDKVEKLILDLYEEAHKEVVEELATTERQ